MSKFNRRRLLLAGLATGATATATTGYLWAKAFKEVAQAGEIRLSKPACGTASSLDPDLQELQEAQAIRASVSLTPPEIAYNREISKRLIQCSRLAVEQYLHDQASLAYDGSIRSLNSYSAQLDGYTQIASFKTHDTNALAPEQAPAQPQKPVYWGFALTSKVHNLIVFRGTQQRAEWLLNLTAFQENYQEFRPQAGKVHAGFRALYTHLATQVQQSASQFDPALPCYVAGHSLGAALAVLASLDLALHRCQIRDQLRLYSYAGPRVGNPSFARLHSEQVPNSYRIVNLADTVPLVPPTKLHRDAYLHVGQEWSFLSQHGDAMPNHIIRTYRAAIEREAETNQPRHYPISGL